MAMDYQELLPVIRQFADRGLQWMLQGPENARGLLSILAPALIDRFDFRRMVVEPPKFISEALHLRETDLVLRVPYRPQAGAMDEDVLVIILLEHQSKPDDTIRLRLLHGESSVWDYQRRRFEGDDTPRAEQRYYPIIPILLYTGEERWAIPESIAAQIGVPDELWEFVPQFRVLQLKVKFTPPEELTAGEHPFRWVLRVIQAENADAEELEAALAAAIRHIEQMSDVDRLSWERALSFLLMLVLHRRDPSEALPIVSRAAEQVSRRHREEATEMAKTAAQALIEEGEERGIIKGVLKTKRDDVLMLMRRKFGVVPKNAEERVHALEDTDRLDFLLGRVLDVDTVEAMGL